VGERFPSGPPSSGVFDSIAADGDIIAVGHSRHNNAGFASGKVWLFSRHQGSANGWGEVTSLVASDSTGGLEFATAIDVEGNTLVVGAPNHDTSNFPPGQGAVYLFDRNHGGPDNWGELKKIVPTDPVTENRFGTSLSLSGETLLVGAPGDDFGFPAVPAAAYFFEKNTGGTGNWGQTRKLPRTTTTNSENFAETVGLSGDFAIVGSPNFGEIHFHARNQGGAGLWGVVATFDDPAEPFSTLGASVGLSGSFSVAGDWEAAGRGGVAYTHSIVDGVPVNLPPVTGSDRMALFEGQTVIPFLGGYASVLHNDSDPELGTLTVNTTPVSGPANGSLTLSTDGTVSYTHDGSETTSDSFFYEARDAQGTTAIGQVEITIAPLNDPPSGLPDGITLAEGGTATTLNGGNSSVLDNDSDPEGSAMTAQLIADVTRGVLSLSGDGTFSYSHNGTESFSDSFQYRPRDASGVLGNPVTVTITIAPVNDNDPIANSDDIEVAEGGDVQKLVSKEESILAKAFGSGQIY